MPHVLPPLDYEYNALEAVIDEQTLHLHHDIHHKGYVDGFNAAEQKLQAARESGDFSAIKHLCREIAFHGSGHILHSIFWKNLCPKGGGEPTGVLADAIRKDFGSFDTFKKQLLAASNAVEGSGWGILARRDMDKSLVILQTEKHQQLTQWGVQPLLVVDVWEHAYYLKYQNKRPAFTEALMTIINWDDVAARYKG